MNQDHRITLRKAGPPIGSAEKTRHALLTAGLKLFGEYGLNGTSTRMLSKLSQANISAISYHFGSKEGLYLAVAEFVAERMRHHTAHIRQQAEKLFAGPLPSPEEAKSLLRNIAQEFYLFFFTSGEVSTWVQFVLREQAEPTEAFHILYDHQIKHIAKPFGDLAAICCQLPLGSPEAQIRGYAFLSQIIGFFISRNSLCKALQVEALGPEHLRTIRQIIDLQVTACLDAPFTSEDVG